MAEVFSGYEAVVQETYTITTASQQVLTPDTTRRAFAIKNTGATTISLGFNKPAVAGTGIVLLAGETFVDSDSGELYTCFKGTVNAYSSAAGGTISVFAR